MDDDEDSCLSDFETETEKTEGENWKVRARMIVFVQFYLSFSCSLCLSFTDYRTFINKFFTYKRLHILIRPI